jgi:hypothetical protein
LAAEASTGIAWILAAGALVATNDAKSARPVAFVEVLAGGENVRFEAEVSVEEPAATGNVPAGICIGWTVVGAIAGGAAEPVEPRAGRDSSIFGRTEKCLAR